MICERGSEILVVVVVVVVVFFFFGFSCDIDN